MENTREIRKLLKLVFGGAAAAVAQYLGLRRPNSRAGRHGNRDGRSWEDATVRAALAAGRCRRAISKASTERERLVAEILRHDQAREVLIAREVREPDATKRDELRRSLRTLDDRLAAWLDEYDALTARIADLRSDLAFLEALAGAGFRSTGQSSGEAGAGNRTHGGRVDTAADADVARHLEALGLLARPTTLVELKAAYRSRLKAVHPDVGTQPSTEAAAAATVAFAELRKCFAHR